MGARERKVHGTPWGKRRIAHVSELEASKRFMRWRRMGMVHNFDYHHSVQVCRLSLALFDELSKVHGMGGKERELLMAAALLHDIGSHRRKGGLADGTTGHEHPHHHKRSQRIILEQGVKGFSRHGTRIVANVARYHTKASPHRRHPLFGELGAKDRSRVRKMASILRIADSLDRRHASMVRDLRCNISKDGREVTVWVFCKKHVFDWRPKHRTGLFERTFEMKVRIQVLFGTAVG